MDADIPYGWIQDLPDHRDYKYIDNFPLPAELPASVDLRAQMPGVYAQQPYQSCTGNAISGAFEFNLKKQGLSEFVPSRLFIYYNERVLEGDVTVDGGAQIRNGIKSVATLGVCNETLWPYNASDVFTKPGDDCYADALNNQLEAYFSLDVELKQLKACLAGGSPFVFGMKVYEAFEGPQVQQTGFMHMPAAGERLLGGHAVLAVGYNDAESHFIIRNSWSAAWGDEGYFYMPYDFMTHYCSDFWVIKQVE